MSFFYHSSIVTSGQTSSLHGFFNVDLTYDDVTFHIGNTRVNYSITTQGDFNLVTYTFFVNDGFWDPDYVDEKLGWELMGFDRYRPDGKGPNLERLGGTPYSYFPTALQFLFPKKY